jgi:Lamin Tail Domain
MFGNAAFGVVLAMVVVGGACVPGAIGPRRGGAMDDAGAAGGEIVVARDAGMAVDVVRFPDAASPEMPKLPPPDAGRRIAEDAGASGDASASGDAPSQDARVDAPSVRAPRVGEVVIDEVLVNPAGDDLGREWIEIANLGADWLDLSGLHLANASVDLAVAGGRIAPGGLRLLGQSADPTKNGGAPVDVAYGTKLILNNANGQVWICVGACASGIVIDTVSWGTLGDDYTGHALVVDPVTRQICAASASFGTAASFGTPGAPNPPCGQNADAGSTADVSVAD